MEFQILKKKRFTNEQISKVIEILKETPNLHAREIANQVPEISARQIKKIRYILKCGTEQDLESVLSCKYYISSIMSGVQNEKKLIKKRNTPVVEKNKKFKKKK
jgi:hypothetical protein